MLPEAEILGKKNKLLHSGPDIKSLILSLFCLPTRCYFYNKEIKFQRSHFVMQLFFFKDKNDVCQC